MFVPGKPSVGGETPCRPHPAELVAAFAALLAVQPDRANGPALAEWLREKARLQACLDGLDLAVTAEFDASGQWGIDGARSAAAWLASNTAAARASAGGHLKTARLARSMPHVSAASRAGWLCEAKVRLLTLARTPEVAELFDQAESLLVIVARYETVDRLSAYLQGWHLRALETLGRNEPDNGPKPPETDADRFRILGGFAGRAVLDGELSPVSREILTRAIAAETASWRRDGLLTEDDRSADELNAAALISIVSRERLGGAEHGAPSPLFLVLLGLGDLEDLEDLADAAPDAGGGADPTSPLPFGSGDLDPTEFAPSPARGSGARRGCEIAGAGPVPLTALVPHLDGADIRRVVLGAEGRPVDVSRVLRRAPGRDLRQDLARAPSLPLDAGRNQREATLAQWIALVARSNGQCEVPGCTVPYWRCQAHHLEFWEHGGRTSLPNLLLACHHDHKHLIHRQGFTITERPGGGYQLHRPDGSLVDLPFGSGAGAGVRGPPATSR